MNTSFTQLIDPEGDVILRLEVPEDGTSALANAFDGKSFPIRVSSETLCSVSTVLRDMIEQALESHESDGPCEIEVDDLGFDLQAFSIVFGILHDNYDDIPDYPDLATIRNMGIVAHHYQCLEQVKGYGQAWLSSLDGPRDVESLTPAMDLQEAADWLFVSQVFHDENAFLGATMTLVEHSTGPLDTDLPIPQGLIDDIQKRRIELLRIASQTTDLHGFDEGSNASVEKVVQAIADMASTYELQAEEAQERAACFAYGETEADELLDSFARLDDVDMESLLGGFRLLDDGSWDTKPLRSLD